MSERHPVDRAFTRAVRLAEARRSKQEPPILTHELQHAICLLSSPLVNPVMVRDTEFARTLSHSHQRDSIGATCGPCIRSRSVRRNALQTPNLPKSVQLRTARSLDTLVGRIGVVRLISGVCTPRCIGSRLPALGIASPQHGERRLSIVNSRCHVVCHGAAKLGRPASRACTGASAQPVLNSW